MPGWKLLGRVSGQMNRWEEKGKEIGDQKEKERTLVNVWLSDWQGPGS